MSCMGSSQSGNSKLNRHAKDHRNDDRNSRDAIGAIPKITIAARTLVAKTIDWVGTNPSEDERDPIKCRENRKCQQQKHKLLFRNRLPTERPPGNRAVFLSRENSSNGGKAIRTFWRHTMSRTGGCQGISGSNFLRK